jgi:prolyl-tRNA synthetase
VLLPIMKKGAAPQVVMDYVNNLADQLRRKFYAGRSLTVEIDDRDIGGTRNWDWIKKGIPVRVEIGPKDIEKNSVFVARRDKPHKEKIAIATAAFVEGVTDLLDEIQANLYARAVAYAKTNTVNIDGKDDFYQFFTPDNPEQPEIHGGFALSHWCGDGQCEETIKNDLAVTIRCIPEDTDLRGSESGACVCCGKPGKERVVFAKAY